MSSLKKLQKECDEAYAKFAELNKITGNSIETKHIYIMGYLDGQSALIKQQVVKIKI
jgi:hypothetical protein